MKKAQEEIVGFMLVVILVVMIGIGFLFFFTPKQAERQDLEMQNLLYSWLAVTMESGNIETVIDNCYQCDLNPAISILDSAISKSGLINSINGYSLAINGSAETYYSSGELTGSSKAAIALLQNNEIKLKFYY